MVKRSGVVISILTLAALIIGGCTNNSGSTAPYVPILPAIDTVRIPAGTFQMGDTNAAIGATPVHSVTLGAFTISQTPVTQAQYQQVMGTNPSYFDSGRAWPVEDVSWYNAALFCNALSKLADKDTVYVYAHGVIDSTVTIDYTKNGYRLPTEAEYEYACRALTTTDYYWGRNYPPDSNADTLALDSNAVWYNNSSSGTQPVASKKPNAFGLYDMSGNVWEWCNDWYDGNYSDSSATNPTGTTIGSYVHGNWRVLRGGAWYPNSAYILSSAFRNEDSPTARFNSVGFRVVCGAR